MSSLEYADCIIEALGEHFCKDPKTQIRALYELTIYTGDESFRRRAKDLCEEYELCPACLNPLKLVQWREDRGDGMFELMSEYQCLHCERKSNNTVE